MIPSRAPRLLAAAFLIFIPSLASAGDFGDRAAAALDLTPERLDAFQRTLREFNGSMDSAQSTSGDLWLTSSYLTPTFMDEAEQADLVLPTDGGLRDVSWMEAFVIEGREDDFEDAASKWLTRKLKGSSMTPRDGSSHGFTTKFGWNDGPIVGLRRGPLTAEMRPDGWRLRLTKRIGQRGMLARAWVGEVDGDMACAFTIGRSLFRATAR